MKTLTHFDLNHTVCKTLQRPIYKLHILTASRSLLGSQWRSQRRHRWRGTQGIRSHRELTGIQERDTWCWTRASDTASSRHRLTASAVCIASLSWVPRLSSNNTTSSTVSRLLKFSTRRLLRSTTIPIQYPKTTIYFSSVTKP